MQAPSRRPWRRRYFDHQMAYKGFYDPMCGSGTIAIEAAMIATGMAPGSARRFDAQNYSNAFRQAFATAREAAATA